jgi:4-amino-4-deoxy-L-arabinose transferase-like glycosyltransferase
VRGSTAVADLTQYGPRALVRRARAHSGLRAAAWLSVFAAVLLLWFAALDARPLWDPDEGRYAEIPREMIASGDWVTPRLNDLRYFEKPPLQYWATALAYEMFGEHRWSSRLWTALTGLAGALLAVYAGARLLDRRAGLYAGAMLASSILYFGLGHFNTLDMGLTLFLEAAIFGLVLALRREASARERRFCIHLAWVAAGLAVLSKGLIGVVLPLGATIAYSLLYRDRTIWRKLAPLTGGALFVAIVAPWFVLVARDNPDFLQFFFVHEHFTRFLTTEHHRDEPWWYFALVLALGTLPWGGPMLGGLWRTLTERTRAGFDPFGFLAVWAIVVFLFFSASGSKMSPYILPVFPALALLAAPLLANAPLRPLSKLLAGCALVPAVACAILPYVLPHIRSGEAATLSHAEQWPFWLAAAPWAAGAVLVLWAARWRNRDAAVVSLALAAMMGGQLVLAGAAEISPAKSTLSLAQQIKPQLRESTRIYVVQIYPQSLPVYLGRTVTLVDYRGELEFGLEREPTKALASTQQFIAIWPRQSDAVAVMTQTLHRQLAAIGLPMTVIARDAARVAVRRP